MPDEEERNHDAILNKAIANGFWLRACDLYLNGFEPSECTDIVNTVQRECVEPPPVAIKDRGRDGLIWTNINPSERRTRPRSRWLR